MGTVQFFVVRRRPVRRLIHRLLFTTSGPAATFPAKVKGRENDGGGCIQRGLYHVYLWFLQFEERMHRDGNSLFQDVVNHSLQDFPGEEAGVVQLLLD